MMKHIFPTIRDASLAATVAPEDLKCGDFVAVLHEVVELPTFLWLDSAITERDEPVRWRRIPDGSGTPLKVKSICLPFVFVKAPLGQYDTIDIRRVQLVRLDAAHARKVRRSMRKQHPSLPLTDCAKGSI